MGESYLIGSVSNVITEKDVQPFDVLKQDFKRYGIELDSKITLAKKVLTDSTLRFITYFRYAHYYKINNMTLKLAILKALRILHLVNYHDSELAYSTEIGAGLYIGHFSGITINPLAKLGRNINIHKGATIGQENRGKRKGAPTIGDNVFIGINSTIVGKITIGNNVLIAPNAYVNFDVPDNSVVVGNPATIKPCDYATSGYVNNVC